MYFPEDEPWQEIKSYVLKCDLTKRPKPIDFLEAILNVINGIWSNFPLCCVLRYTKDAYYYNYTGMKRFVEVVNSDDDFARWEKYHYVPCRHCFKTNNIVKSIRSGGLPIVW